ncbi:MAG: M48 family metallopeptidase [Thermodesulfobacteriota bacterium]
MSPSDPEVAASFFDGASSQRHAVRLRAAGGQLRIEGEGWSRELPCLLVRVSEPMGAAPRILTLPDRCRCEVPPQDGLAELLLSLGHRDASVVHWQSRWRHAAAALAAVVLLVAAGYLWGLPWLADTVAAALPASWVNTVSEETVAVLEERLFEPTGLPASRQQALREGLAGLVQAAPAAPSYRLLFRSAPKVGANAFAFPNGDIVLLDQLVALTADDEEVLAVLAHELGHLADRHSLRQLIRSTVVSFLVGAYLGDISSLASGLATMLLQAGYSREFEWQADRYAAHLLIATGRSPILLATMLRKLEKGLHRPPDEESDKDNGDADAGAGDSIFASHPDTLVRIQELMLGR